MNINPPKRRVDHEKLLTIINLTNQIRSWLPRCQYTDTFSGVSKDTCVSERTGTGDGDVTKFSGLLCLSGEELGCETLIEACEYSGRCWRSPARRIYSDSNPTLSRDQFLGIMGYLIRKRDLEFSERIFNYHRGIGDRICESKFHDECEFRGTTAALFGRVLYFLKQPVPKDWQQFMFIDDASLLSSAKLSQVGYQLELIASTILMRQMMNSYTITLQEAAMVLKERQPLNPFFVFVHEGASDRVLDLMIEQMPRSVPEFRDRWSFEVESDREPWKRSMGWEWVFLTNLLIWK